MTLDAVDRTALYHSLGPASQFEIWAQRFETYRSSQHDRLSPAQLEVLDRAIEISRKGDKGAIPQIGEDAVKEFGLEEAARVFASLKSTDGGDEEEEAGQRNGAEALAVDCDCLVGGIPSCLRGVCLSSSTCVVQPSGCGWWWSEQCNGRCFVL
jgi:hypothetical protein